MIDFNNLINNINANEKIEVYFQNFFTKENFKSYKINEKANKEQTKAIKVMFESKKNLLDRVEESFSYDPFCVEAFFVYMMLSEDVFLQLRFNSYYEDAKLFGSFDAYQKECYLKILDFYVEFLLDINNITKAISIQKLIIQFSKHFSKNSISRLAFSYFTIENYIDFYDMYLNVDFSAYEYILLIITLLKHEETIKAQEVLLDMYKNIEFSSYLDHVWDLDESNPKQKEFANVVEDCFDDIKSIPTFFSWVNNVREKYGK